MGQCTNDEILGAVQIGGSGYRSWSVSRQW